SPAIVGTEPVYFGHRGCRIVRPALERRSARGFRLRLLLRSGRDLAGSRRALHAAEWTGWRRGAAARCRSGRFLGRLVDLGGIAQGGGTFGCFTQLLLNLLRITLNGGCPRE